MKNYITVCDDYEWLLMETQQIPLSEALEPYRDNIIFVPVNDGDLAKVKDKEYIFQNGKWESVV